MILLSYIIISLFSNFIKESLVFAVLLFKVYNETQKILKWFAFASKSDVILVSIRSGGMIGTFFSHCKKFLKVTSKF